MPTSGREARRWLCLATQQLRRHGVLARGRRRSQVSLKYLAQLQEACGVAVYFTTHLGYKRLQAAQRSLSVLLAMLCILNATPYQAIAALQDQSVQLLERVASTDVGLVSADEVAASADAAAVQLRGVAVAVAQGADTSIDKLAREVILEVFDLVDHNYLDARNSGFDRSKWAYLRDEALARSYRDEAALQRAVRDMLAKGCSDPYTRYIAPYEFSSIVKYDISGVGLNLGSAEEYVKKARKKLPQGRDAKAGVYVVGLISNSEADARGIEQGDEIVEVAGKKVGEGQAAFQIASQIHGSDRDIASGLRDISVTVKKLDGSNKTVLLTRPVTQAVPSPVSYRVELIYGQRVGYIKLRSFNNRAQPDVQNAVAALDKQGVESFAIDLRGNTGGVVSEGVEVAKLFLDPKVPVVRVQDRNGGLENILSSPDGPITTKPITVFVNSGTASAAEIMAGALRDNCRVALVGDKTFGKGLMQSVYQLQDGSGVVLTTMRYLTPSGVDIDRSGLVPDFTRVPSPSAVATQLKACKKPT